MQPVFKEVQVEKVSDKIADQLALLIQDGRLLPGDKLPSERDLIKMMNVGRSSLREALNRLEILGFVEIRKRKGIFVKAISSTLHLDPLKDLIQQDQNQIPQLYEVRADIEQNNAYHAARNRNHENIAELEQCLERLGPARKEGRFTWDRDQAFHVAVARASQNVFRIHALLNIFDFARDLVRPVIEKVANLEDNSVVIGTQHARIARAVIDQDAREARRLMKEHLAWTNTLFKTYFKKS